MEEAIKVPLEPWKRKDKTVSAEDAAYAEAMAQAELANEKALYSKPNYVVARYYDDEDNLLYVSSTPQLHMIMKNLWSQDVKRIMIEWFQTKSERDMAKIIACRDEEPLYNIHNR